MQSIQTIIAAISRWCASGNIGHYAVLLLVTALVSGCISPNQHGNRHAGNGFYTVKPTDTLYSIAWRYGLDYQELAGWNQISDDYIISVGQRLAMFDSGDPSIAQAPTASAGSGSSMTRQSTSGSNTRGPKPPVSTAQSGTGQPGRWIWPVDGKLLSTFSIKQLDRRGIKIGGQLGQPIRATAGGKVVYSGNGLAGYGNLIIIKHSDTYLSAYAYCKKRLVSEGAVVKAGAIIANMGQHKNKSARLHFEIRKNGKPVDPIKYLPGRTNDAAISAIIKWSKLNGNVYG